ncbi:MAG: winged helix-turn-helix transcriptional regulator [Clostridiales bacterium]|nr:winged helix-turn-helix transcriptional regulator [Candidatus Cacconaster stercorequi]
MDVLFRSKDVEKSGTGFQRVNSLCEQNHIGWDFRKEAYGFYFEFIRTNGRINVSKNGSLTKDEDQILHILQDNPGISKSEMAIKINKSERTVQRILASLTEKKLIVREGSNKKGLWKCV